MAEPVKEIKKEVVDIAKKLGAESSQEMYLEEIQKLIETAPEDLTEQLLNQSWTRKRT